MLIMQENWARASCAAFWVTSFYRKARFRLLLEQREVSIGVFLSLFFLFRYPEEGFSGAYALVKVG